MVMNGCLVFQVLADHFEPRCRWKCQLAWQGRFKGRDGTGVVEGITWDLPTQDEAIVPPQIEHPRLFSGSPMSLSCKKNWPVLLGRPI